MVQLVILDQPVMLAVMEPGLTLEMQELPALQATLVQQAQELLEATQEALVQPAT